MNSFIYSFQFLMKLEFSPTDIRTVLLYQISWKSVQWESSCSHKRTHMTKIIAGFHNAVEVPNCHTLSDVHYSYFKHFCKSSIIWQNILGI